MKIYYEVKAYITGEYDARHFGFGSGKRAKTKALKKAFELQSTGLYEAIFVDAYNDEEIIDAECVSMPFVEVFA